MCSSSNNFTHFSQGNTSATILVNKVINTSPNGAKTIASSLKTTSDYKKYTPDGALSLIISNNLTKRQYEVLCSDAKSRNYNIYPSYYRILQAKNAAYPPDIKITEQICEISLQTLLNHTSKRLLQSLTSLNFNSGD